VDPHVFAREPKGSEYDAPALINYFRNYYHNH